MEPFVQFCCGNKISKLVQLAALATVLFFFSACDDLKSGTIEFDSELNTTIQLHTGEAMLVQQANQISAEVSISEITVLAFENGLYKYAAVGKNIVQSTSGASFAVTLRKTTNTLDLFVLANSNTAISSNIPAVGDSKLAVASKLATAYTASGLSGNFPMFGSYSSATGINTLVQNTLSVSMMRHVARVDIDASAVSSNFTLIGAKIYRASSLAQIIPNSLSSSSAVTSPSVPALAAGTVTSNLYPISGNTSVAQLYIPEVVAPSNIQSNACCLIISGYYNGSSTPTYYRLDFDPQISGHPNGQVLRNYIYKFSLQGIYASGYTLESDAVSNSSKASSYTVKVWNSSTVTMAFDGFNYIGVSANPAYLSSPSGATVSVGVDTNSSSYTLQWASDASGTPVGTAASSLNDGTFSVVQASGGATIQITALSQNSTSASITRYVLVHAGSLSLVFSFVQSSFTVTPSPIILSASGGKGYALVKSTSLWAPFGDQSWLSLARTPGVSSIDTLKITSTTNPTTSSRTGTITFKLLDGNTNTVSYTQNGQNTTVVNMLSWNNDYAYFGSDLLVSSAEGTAQGFKGIVVNSSNFGSTGTVNMGGHTITGINANPITSTSLNGINIMWVSTGALTTASADAIYTWLTGASNRVLVFNFGRLANTYLLSKLGVNLAYQLSSTGVFPVQYNSNTTYFTTTGPFTSYPYTPLSSSFSYRNRDGAHAELSITYSSQILPIMLGPDGGILLGIDKTKRVLYIGDVDLMNVDPGTGATTNNYIQNTSGVVSNDASKIMANVWAWVVLTAQGKPPI